MLNQLKYKLMNLMRGRYGMDALYRALMGLTLAAVVLNLFLPSPVFSALVLLGAGLAFFRAFSKNLQARAAENQKYLAFQGRLKQKWLQLKNRFRDRKTHRYRACPNCRQSLRLKKKVGVNHIRCPKCQHEFEVNIRF